MNYSTEEIAKTLKEARKSKGLSQRELSVKSGVPQSHISKIESGAVDLRVSSLTSLARDLGLELALIPRKTVPAVNSIVRSNERQMGKATKEGRIATKELERIQNSIVKMTKTDVLTNATEKLQRQIREIQRFDIQANQLNQIKEIGNTFQRFQKNTANIKAFEETLSQVDRLRNTLAHAQFQIPKLDFPRSAYSLEGEDND
jgi:transcriptional regulator with XRE-family HTH domain